MSERGHMSMILPSGGRLDLLFPMDATQDDVWFARGLIRLQVDNWQRYNLEREQKIVDKWCEEITSIHYADGYPCPQPLTCPQ